ncbi:PH domain-containing protein [Schaalia vaccimaxillae]|uniref:PH domain-containing protein n=1 Tax=Schaalia vaccimaxillae TaxID=183916 RepID=UPI0003B551C7|nr:PH domain-containing protein [Schaalia vaccimaxillae]
MSTEEKGRPVKVRKTSVVDEGVPADQWRKIHPISPIINAWKALAALAAFVVYQNYEIFADLAQTDFARQFSGGQIAVALIGSALVFLLIAAGYSWLAWRATSFAVTGTAVWFRHGILQRSQRHARLDRIQAVDLFHPLLGRIFGLGKLNIEVAGGNDSNLTFGYLKTEELEALRAEILARAAGIVLDEKSEAPDDGQDVSHAGLPGHTSSRPQAPVAAERSLYTIPVGRLVGSIALSMGVAIMGLIAVGLVVGIVVLAFVIGPEILGSLLGLLPIILGIGGFIWSRFAGEFNFTAAVSADGIRVRRGLLETRSQTIPPRRVHAVQVTQPWLWRRKDWYRVTIVQAGVGGKSGESSNDSAAALAGHVLLPVGTRAEAELALWLVIRDLGVQDPQIFLDVAFKGRRDGQGFVPVPVKARWLDWFSYKRRAYALTDSTFVVRDGWLTHTTAFVPIERAQSLNLNQGPIERKLGLANVHVNIVPGQIQHRANHVEVGQAKTLLEELRIKSGLRRSSEPPEKWMIRVSQKIDNLPAQGIEAEGSLFDEDAASEITHE